MHQSDGQWQVYDVTVDAISLIANYRNQFNRIINNEGYPKLIADLEAKRQQLREYIDQEARTSASD
jgi:phospholipid transport system substrate-binding protein